MAPRVSIEVKRQRLEALHAAMVELQQRRRERRSSPFRRRGRHRPITPEEREAAKFREAVAVHIGQALLLTTDDGSERARDEATRTGRSAIEVFLSDLGGR